MAPAVTVIMILAIHTNKVLETSAIDLVKELICFVTLTPQTLKIAIVKTPKIQKLAKLANL